ncbi:MAG TPA: DUF1189 family protein [Verrucomicrobiae bacterium]|nr:DUF1189 family protein [Verrucomicrobiae bacterium]
MVVALCSSFRSYRQVRDLAVSTSLKHLIVLLSLLSLILLISFVPWVLGRSDAFAHWVDQHLPRFSIHEGKVTSSAPQPYYASDGDFLFILDTTGKITGPDPKAVQGILFTADSFVVWLKTTNAPEGIVQSQRQSLRGFPDGVVNGDYFRKLVRTFLWVGLPLALVVLILLALLSTLLQAYLFSIVASFMERSMPSPLRLQQLLNISIHAVTPAAIIVTAYMAMRLHDLNLWLIYLVAYGIFLIGATNACRDKQQFDIEH